MDTIFKIIKKKQIKIHYLWVFGLFILSSCSVFENEPQIEITVVDSNQNVVADATVKLLYATNPDYEFEGGTHEGIILSETEWEDNYAVEAESSTTENGKILFTELTSGVKFCRIKKGLLSNNLGIQWVGMANTDQQLKVTIEIK